MFGFSVKGAVAVATVATMIGSSAFAADGALAPGKPAGVKPALQIGTGTLLIGGMAAAIGIGIGVAVSNSGQNNTAGVFSTTVTGNTAP